MAIYTFTEIAEWAESQTGLTYAYMCIHVSIYNTSPLTAQAHSSSSNSISNSNSIATSLRVFWAPTPGALFASLVDNTKFQPKSIAPQCRVMFACREVLWWAAFWGSFRSVGGWVFASRLEQRRSSRSDSNYKWKLKSNSDSRMLHLNDVQCR